MSDIWEHASKKHPCVVCAGTDWCQFGLKAMLCRRVASDRPHMSQGAVDGHYHFYDKDKPVFVPRGTVKPAPQSIDCYKLMKDWRLTTKAHQFETFAANIGVAARSLFLIGAAFSHVHRAWAFPMKDETGNVCGIRLRSLSGHKWAVTGSRQGIFVPDSTPEKIAYLPEGPTDTCAAISLGLFAIGRPTCSTGDEQIKQTLKRLAIYKVVIVNDNDEEKQIGSRRGYPGTEGAAKLQKHLGLRSVVWSPPSGFKDFREFAAATKNPRAVIESEINNRTWTK